MVVVVCGKARSYIEKVFGQKLKTFCRQREKGREKGREKRREKRREKG
jgi:hypothetical protein